jgi:hypothetical protein
MHKVAALRPQFIAMRSKYASVTNPNDRAWALARGVWRVCRANGVQPLRVVVVPLVQLPLLLGMVVAVRRMLLPDAPHAPGLREGGTLWFVDLTAPDPKAVLPLISLALLLGNLQLSGAATQNPVWLMLRNVMQAASMVALPLYAELPAGVFLYWIPNSAFSLLQTSLVRRTRLSRQLRGLEPLSAATSPPVHVSRLRGPSDGVTLAEPRPDVDPSSIGASPPRSFTGDELVWRRRIDSDARDTEAHVKLSKMLMKEQRLDDAVAHLWPAVQAIPQEESGPVRFQVRQSRLHLIQSFAPIGICPSQLTTHSPREQRSWRSSLLCKKSSTSQSPCSSRYYSSSLHLWRGYYAWQVAKKR